MKFLVLLALLLPFSVSATTGAEFAGKWVHVRFKNMQVEISENGSNFVITKRAANNVEKYAAKMSDGLLVANTGPCALNVDIERKSGNLIFNGQEYRKMKAGE